MGRLVLQDSDGRTWEAPSPAAVDAVLSRLIEDADAYVILERGPCRFMQAAHPGRLSPRGAMIEALQLEFQDGSEEQHWITFSDDTGEVLTALIEYSQGVDDWRDRFHWRRLDLAAPTASSSSSEPKHLVAAACAEIAAYPVFEGFRFVKARRAMNRVCGEWRYQVRFGTSAHNAKGQLAELSGEVAIFNTALEAWRTERGLYTKVGKVAMTTFGGVVPGGRQNPAWNLVTEYETAVWHAAWIIERQVLPYFGLFDDGFAFVDELADDQIGSFFHADIVELLVCKGDLVKLRSYLERLATVGPIAFTMIQARVHALGEGAEVRAPQGAEPAGDALFEAGLAALVDDL